MTTTKTMLSIKKSCCGVVVAAVVALLVAHGHGQATGSPAAPSGGLLPNDGETSSLNTVVHYLFNIPMFRQAVYASDDSSPFVKELQKIFFEMQYRGCSDTKMLAGLEEWSFVEDPGTADVSELLLVMLGNILGETDIGPAINDIFGGTFENTIEAPSVNFKSSKREFFLSLFLQVEGFDGVIASLMDQTSPERLEGENGISVEGQGIVDGIRTSKIAELPPVLQLESRRFVFNGTGVEKVTTPFAAPRILDFGGDNSGILVPAEPSNPDGPGTNGQQYRLHSIISGSPIDGSTRTFLLGTEADSDMATEFKDLDVLVRNATDVLLNTLDDSLLHTYVAIEAGMDVDVELPAEKRALFFGEGGGDGVKPDARCMQ